ncbi:MAG: insulinase family protein [Proteobacteria bacterium]|nr:insulinase family protein [Pseudomonadota bacterium]
MIASYASLFHPQTFFLDNGLQVVFMPNHLAPMVSVAVCYKVGSADDPPTMVGLSHFLEHMMFEGTTNVPKGEFSQIVSSHGGMANASTTSDYTVYTTDIASEHLELLLKLEADRMENLAFTGVEEEKQVIMEERLMRYDNNPLGQAVEVLLKNNFWYHPYSVPPMGYPAHILAYSHDAAMQHYKNWYAPNNVVLIICGHVDFNVLKELVTKHFAGLSPRSLPERERPTEPDHQGLTATIEQYGGRVRQDILAYYYAAPNHLKPQSGISPQHFYALILLAQILGGDENSRLYHEFVEKQGLVLVIDIDYNHVSLDPQPFGITMILTPGVSFSKVQQALSNLIKEVVEKGVSDDELLQAKRSLVASLAFARDGTNGSVKAMYRLLVGFRLQDIDQWPQHFESITKEDIQAAAKALFEKPPVSILKLSSEKPKKSAQKSWIHKITEWFH